MLKKQKKILKYIGLLLIIGITSTYITQYLSPASTTNWVEEKFFKQEPISTIDPWLKKRWEHVRILSKTVNNFKISKTILLWTKFFGATDYVPKLSSMCPLPKCHVTSNRDFLNTSDAVIFHLRDLNLKDMPHQRSSKQIWILLHHESPPHTPPNILDQLGNTFNWTATYRFDSEITLSPVAKEHNRKVVITKNFARGKSKMLVWFVSNCKTPGNREGFVRELQKSIPVDIYGSCGTLTCLPKMSDECFAKVSNIYRFYLSFENSICKDYVTEKLYHVLSTDMIPVVFGGANYSQVAPPSSYIDALAFKSPKDLANYLFKVAKDEKLYNSYFEWRKTYEITASHYACNICQKLHEPVIKPTVYSNVSAWWFGDANCKTWPI